MTLIIIIVLIIMIIISEQASIYMECSMEIRDRYIFICMYSFFYGTFTRASTINLDSATNSWE